MMRFQVLKYMYIFVITCWERADLSALLCVMFPYVFVTFQYGVSGQVWYLIVSIPDPCRLFYFKNRLFKNNIPDYVLKTVLPLRSASEWSPIMKKPSLGCCSF